MVKFKRKMVIVLAAFFMGGAGLSMAQTASDAPPKAIMPEIQNLQDEIRKIQRDYIDLQKSLMESGAASPTLKDDLAAAKNLGTLASDVAVLKKEKEELLAAIEASKKATGSEAGAPAAASGSLADLMKTAENQTLAINVVWTLICAFIVMFMQAGFALVETGFTRAKNVAHTMSMNFMIYALGMMGYWFIGFGIEFGGTGAEGSASTVGTLGPDIAAHLNSLLGFSIGDGYWGLIGGAGYCLPPSMLSGPIFTLFLFQGVFMSTTATVPTGSMAERWKFLSFCIFGLLVGAIIYPLYGCWVWGGGWLAALGKNLGLGNGHVDFAGSSVVHLSGGILALVGAKILGPRIGKFNKNGSSNPIPGHNIPMGMLGTFILGFGWFGFNPGSTLSGLDMQIGIIATNTMLALVAGAVTGMIVTWIRFGKPDPSFMCNGMLAGAVAITAPCAFVDSWAAVLIGVIGGILVVFAAMIIEEKFKIDDPVGAIAVHGANGAWGCIALGLFANGKYGAGWNGVDTAVTGLFYGNPSQLMAQIVGVVACIVAVGFMGWVTFKSLDKIFGLRVSPADELSGLDIPELGVLGYQPDVQPESR